MHKASGSSDILALNALTWLAGDNDGIERFLTLSGTDAATLRDGAGSRETGVAVLDFLLGQEDLLLRFCESAGLAPGDVQLAQYRLSGDSGSDA